MSQVQKDAKAPAEASVKANSNNDVAAKPEAKRPRAPAKKTTMTTKLAEEAKLIVGDSKLDLNAGRQLRSRAAPAASAKTAKAGGKRGQEPKAKAGKAASPAKRGRPAAAEPKKQAAAKGGAKKGGKAAKSDETDDNGAVEAKEQATDRNGDSKADEAAAAPAADASAECAPVC